MSKVVNMDPSKFVSGSDDFDLVEELEENSREHEPGCNGSVVTVRNFPNWLRTAVDSVRAHVKETDKPSLSVTISAAASHGVGFFYANKDLESLVKLEDELNKLGRDSDDADLVEQVWSLLRHWKLEVPPSMTGSSKLTVQCPSETKNQIAHRATELGLSTSTLLVLCVMVTISKQSTVHPDHAKRCEDVVRKVLKIARTRRRMCEVAVQEVTRPAPAIRRRGRR